MCSENKGADQLPGYQLACAFVAYSNCWFSHAMAHLFIFFTVYMYLVIQLM